MKRTLQMVTSASLGLVLVWLLFRNTDWQAILRSISGIKFQWLLLSQLCAWSGYFARAKRWSYVVRAGHPATFRSIFSATQIGFLVNFTVPLRLGEVVRAFVLTRLARVPFSQSLAMVGLDRVNDLLVLLLILLVALFSFPSGQSVAIQAGAIGNPEPFVVSNELLEPAATSLTILVGAVTLAFLLLYLNQSLVLGFIDHTVGRISRDAAQRLRKVFLGFAAGMRIFRSGGDLLKSIFFSVLTWACSLLSLSAILIAFSIDFPWYTPFFMLAMIAVFITVPITPGVVGQYHIPIVASMLLTIPGADATEAKAVAIVAHILSLIPIGILGGFCLIWERLSMTSLASQAALGKQEIKSGMQSSSGS